MSKNIQRKLITIKTNSTRTIITIYLQQVSEAVLCVYVCVPPHSCHTLSSESTVEGDRSGRLSTISYALGYL